MTKHIIGAHADFGPGDYRFERQRQDAERVELERSRPVESWVQVAVGWGIILCCAGLGLRTVLFIYEVMIARGILTQVSP